jgi:hypothetical protein
MQSRLQSIRDELQFRILVSIKEENIQGLDEASRNILKDIVNSNRVLHTLGQNILTEQMVEGARAEDRHRAVLHAILSRNLEAPSVDDIPQKLQGWLCSPQQDHRFEDIAQAHQETFKWTLEKNDPAQIGTDLLNWLQSLSGTYWISGKAGSGKSTLMKYLVQDPRFKQALQEWAGDDNLVIATFYFWRAGVPVQRSQTGLLQSLLWQVLNQQPTMGSLLFPEQYVYGAIWTEFPTFYQLRRAFNRFANHITSSAVVPIKVAFIIDGLDEFEKDVIDFKDLAEIFLTSSKSSNVKALVSSRPLPAFESSFEGMPQLRLHELTHGDIAAYVEADLGPRLRSTNSLTHGSNNNTDLLLTEVVDAAAGVFLWVKLVVRSLNEGVDNGDNVEDLRIRLEALPRDLEALFDHMIKNIPDSYKTQSSQIFQLLHGHQTAKTRSLTAINLLIALDWNETSVLEAPLAAMTLAETERENVERGVDRRLQSRCVGLLEFRTRILQKCESRDGTVIEEETHKDVVYLHRTVADYLSKPDIWKRILGWTAGTEFNACRLLLQSVVMEMKTTKLFPDMMSIWPVVRDAMNLARCAEDTGNVPTSALLQELDKAVALHFAKVYESSQDYTWHFYYVKFLAIRHKVPPSPTSPHDDLLSLMVLYGLHHSVAGVLSTRPKAVSDKKGRSLLHYTCLPAGAAFHLGIPPRMTQILLENDADPNRVFNEKSAWQHALEAHERLYKDPRTLKKFSPPIYQGGHLDGASTLLLFAKHGADPKACIDGQRSALQVLKARFESFLKGLMDEQATQVVVGYLRHQSVNIPEGTNSAKSLARIMSAKHKDDLKQLRDIASNLIRELESTEAKAEAKRKGKDARIRKLRDQTLGLFGRSHQ